jgi:hypothetical protein
MVKIIKHFSLDQQGYNQYNVDFLDLYLGIDNQLFLDYNKILQGNSSIYRVMRTDITVFMKHLFRYLGSGQDKDLSILLDGLHETNATHLGLSKGSPRGKSVGNELKEKIFENLIFLKDAMLRGNLEIDSIYFGIKNIGPDRISDIVTSIIKNRLIEFTQQQCTKHSIFTQKVAVSKVFNSRTVTWDSKFVELPFYQNKPVLFIPKDIVSTYDGISGTFHAFVSYGFHNFFKGSIEYKKLIRGDSGNLDSNLKRCEFNQYNKDHGLNDKAISQKMLTEFENKDVVGAFSEIRKNIHILSDDDLIEIIENNLKKAN